MNEKYLQALRNKTEFYPHNLENKFPHILERIMVLWGSSSFDSHINTLMLDKRDHHRQGFPPEVASEILRLSILHNAIHKTVSSNSWVDSADAWVD